jgi:uncharacterized membrane protein YkoI
MKIKLPAGLALAALLAAGCATRNQDHHASQAKLLAEAKVSREDATRTALDQVPNGMVKSSELEKEHGKLIWSFELSTPGSSDITEVNVDAVSGTVVSTEKESAEQESNEKD